MENNARTKGIAEHLDIAMRIEKDITPMKKPEITQEKVRETVENMENKKQQGHTILKQKCTKLGQEQEMPRNDDTMLQKELELKEKPQEWKISKTRMREKTKRHTVRT